MKGCCLLGLSSFVVNVVGAVESSQPNIILMMADDFCYECVRANGGESYQTPHLDRLAAAGMRFEQCHVQPLCTPTRVQLMTGRYKLSGLRHARPHGTDVCPSAQASRIRHGHLRQVATGARTACAATFRL